MSHKHLYFPVASIIIIALLHTFDAKFHSTPTDIIMPIILIVWPLLSVVVSLWLLGREVRFLSQPSLAPPSQSEQGQVVLVLGPLTVLSTFIHALAQILAAGMCSPTASYFDKKLKYLRSYSHLHRQRVCR